MTEPGNVELHDYDLPEVIPGSVLVKVNQSNVCGSELHIFNDQHPYIKNAVLGHEMIGQILELGEGVTIDYAGNTVKKGDSIVAPYYLTCQKCRACRNGQFHLCENAYTYWSKPPTEWPYFNGAFSTHYYIHPNQYFYKVPDNISSKVAASANCALSQVYFGIDESQLSSEETIVIQGAGGLGINATAVAKERGANVIIIDAVASRLELAKEFGADETINLNNHKTVDEREKKVKELTDNWGADVGIELTGVPDSFSEGIKLVRPGGRYVAIGTQSPGTTTAVDPGLLVRKSVRIIPLIRYNPWYLYKSLKFLEQNQHKYPFESLLDASFDLSEIQTALDKSARREVTRATINCS
ncbi:zinc-binding dehydrogenase [Salicibibacter cibi]|uniref:Zinc-binding dehydrogenase n=2 Tax=Salicibibacter cibi TaxID=2743001 RepID=A0A7T7CH98_9BACI|nr:zinc-binding dehydrogenase [Salicibibacter cibi]